MSEEQYRAWILAQARGGGLKPMPVYPKPPPRRMKYGNKPTVVCGEVFDSGSEAKRYEELLLLERAGKISQLRHHVRYPLEVNGLPICEYECDFAYVDELGMRHVEDVKCRATITPVYRLKKKLMAAIHGIVVEEVMT